MVDIKDVPRDEVLPSLHCATDGEGIRRRLEPYFGDRVRLLQVKVGRFTYKPGRNARFAYRIKLLDLDRDLKVRHVMHGRMEPQAEFEALQRKMSKRTWARPAYGPAFLAFEDLGIALWGFPNDPKLDGIEHVAQPEAMLVTAQRSPAFAAFAPRACQSAIVKYVPGKRLVMKHRLTGADGTRMLVFSKTYAHARGEAIHAVMHDLWSKGTGDPESFRSPEPIAWLPEARTLVLRALPGTAAIAALAAATLGRDMESAGRGLARIHRSDVQGLEPWTAREEHAHFHKVTRTLEHYDADLQPLLERVRGLADERYATLSPTPPAPIHGAFRFTQLLSWRDRLALVDFDGFRQGDPMVDVGSFAAHLYYLDAKGELEPGAARAAVGAFLAGYAAHAPLDAGNLRWTTAVILVAKHAQKCVKRLKDDGDAKIRRMLDIAAGILDGTEPMR